MAKTYTKPGPKPIQLDLDKIESLAAQQLSQQQICDCLGISMATLQRRKSQTEQLEQAIARGKAKGLAIITNKHFEAAKAGNVDAQKHILRCKAGWTEVQKIQHQGDPEQPLVIVIKEKAK